MLLCNKIKGDYFVVIEWYFCMVLFFFVFVEKCDCKRDVW